MLINALRAENFMKFRNLSIEGLPESGLIGIEGRNEGGKSTIGELIQFALFGKTIGTRQSTIHELIHWETDHCMVELDFSVERQDEGATAPIERYRIWREVDRYGANFARLVRLDDRVEVASGLMHVQEMMARLIRFDFGDFERSFYLSEKDFARSPESMKSFLDRMVGADVLERVEAEVEEEAAEYEVQFGRLQAEIQRNQLQIEKYVPNIARIPEVEKSRDEHEQRLVGLSQDERERQAEYDATEAAVREREGQRDRLRSTKSRPAQKLGEGLRHALRAYGETPKGPLESSTKELDKVKARLTRLVTLCEAFDDLCQKVDDAVKALGDRLSGDGGESFPSQMRQLDERIEREQSRRGRAAKVAVLWLVLGVVLGAGAAGLYFEFIPTPEGLEGNALLGTQIGAGGGCAPLLDSLDLDGDGDWATSTRSGIHQEGPRAAGERQSHGRGRSRLPASVSPRHRRDRRRESFTQ